MSHFTPSVLASELARIPAHQMAVEAGITKPFGKTHLVFFNRLDGRAIDFVDAELCQCTIDDQSCILAHVRCDVRGAINGIPLHGSS